MSRIVIAPNDEGTAAFTLTSPNTDIDVQIELPTVFEDAQLLSNLDDLPTLVAYNALFFSAVAAVNQVVATGVYTKVNLGTQEIDTHSVFDPATSRFTAPDHGWYQLTGAGTATGTGTFSANYALYVNGANIRIVMSAASTGETRTFCAPVYLRRGDYVELWANVIGTGTLTHLGARLAGTRLTLDADQT